jgi:hypothetical protein
MKCMNCFDHVDGEDIVQALDLTGTLVGPADPDAAPGSCVLCEGCFLDLSESEDVVINTDGATFLFEDDQDPEDGEYVDENGDAEYRAEQHFERWAEDEADARANRFDDAEYRAERRGWDF